MSNHVNQDKTESDGVFVPPPTPTKDAVSKGAKVLNEAVGGGKGGLIGDGCSIVAFFKCLVLWTCQYLSTPVSRDGACFWV